MTSEHKHLIGWLAGLWSTWFGSLTLSHVHVMMGILSGAAVFVYTILQIRKLLREERVSIANKQMSNDEYGKFSRHEGVDDA